MAASVATPLGGSGTCRREDVPRVTPLRVATFRVAEGTPTCRTDAPVVAQVLGRACSTPRSTARERVISTGISRTDLVRLVFRPAPGHGWVRRTVEGCGSPRRMPGIEPVT